MKIHQKINPLNINTLKSAFTLLELAVSFVILGLLLSTTLPWVQWQWQHQSYLENQQKLLEIEKSLYGYIKQYGKIPCPSHVNSIDVDGLEQRDVNGLCVNSWGILPWQTLGVNRYDRFGHLYHYHIDQRFVNSTTFDYNTTPDLILKTRTSTTNPHPLIDEFRPIAMVISHGAKNFLGDELINYQEKTNGENIKVIRTWQPQNHQSCNDEAGGLCPFDDQIIAISAARFWFYKP
jgi:type II secretory pathway pseudopilin PulG